MMTKSKLCNGFGMARYWSLITVSVFQLNSYGNKPENRPNIVVIMADDMGYSDIGCYGSEISTPNLDWLANHGLRFRNFYNNAKCCPTRASLLTGLYNHEAGMGNMVTKAGIAYQPGPYQGFLNQGCVTIAEVIRPAGYSTYMSGKWHVGEREEHWPLQRGFDKYFGLISGASSYFEIVKEAPVRKMAYGNESWTPPAKGFYMTDAITDSAVAFLKLHVKAKKENPFFIYVAYTSPHWPLHALDEDIKKYKDTYTKGWESVRMERYKKMVNLGIISEKYTLSERSPGIPSWDEIVEKDLWIRRMQVYAAMIDRMDQGIGRVIGTLKKLNKLENTLIIFLSDNGGSSENVSAQNRSKPGILIGEKGSNESYGEPWANVSDTPFRYYKNWMYEGGIITPLIVCWPKVLKGKGRLTSQVGHVIDIMPTCMEVSGAKYPEQFKGNSIQPLRGISLVSAIKGNSAERTSPLFWEHSGGKAMRQGSWKLVKKNNHNWELFNLDTDPTELNNLSGKQSDRLKNMIDSFERWAREVGAKPSNSKEEE